MNMDFEYDPQKSELNKSRHNIDFDEAKVLWNDDDYAEIELEWENEPRFMVIGKIDEKHWSAICTDRRGKTRIISVRRSRSNEVRIYEENG